MIQLRNLALIIVVAAAPACDRAGADPHASASPRVAVVDTARPWRKPGDKIDSILPMSEYIRRFRDGRADPARFTGGADSREALAKRFLSGVSRRDTAALANLLVTRAEFGWLIFPEHRYAVPPYELDPAVFWMQLRSQSQVGFHRLLERYGGKRIGFVGLTCQRDTLQIVTRRPTRSSPVIWSPCLVRYRVSYDTGDSTFTKRLFGSIVVRDGRAKLMTYSNDF